MRLVGGNEHRSGEGAAKGDPSADCLAGAESNVKDLEQWVCWRSEVRGRDGKKTKVPYSPRSGYATDARVGDQPRAEPAHTDATNATDARSRQTDDGRERFTL